jgi:hypothetical protein
MQSRDLAGMKFGRLTVIGLTSERRHGHRLWRTLCDCGVEKIVAGSHLTRGQTKSCGCLQAEMRRAYRIANKRSNTYRIVGNTAEIDLTKGQVAVIDAADLPRVIDGRGKWFAHRSDDTRSYYATRHGGQSMARVILDAPAGMEVDHRNHRTLDNRRQNLRLAMHAENTCNRRPPASSGYVGVSWNKAHRKWMSHIRTNGRHRHLGYFDSKIEAAIMRDVFARLYHKEFAYLNFPLAPDSLGVAA